MATKTLYKVQLGAYKNKENAEKTAAVVRIHKFPAAVIHINGLWKVQSGAFSIKSNAEKRLKDIHEAGLHLKDAYKSYKNTFCKAIMVTVPGEQKKEDNLPPYVRVWAIRFWESDREKYGDATAFIQYESDNKTIKHVILVDTGMNYTDTIKKLKAAGVTKIDAVIISHDHADHYGYLSNDTKNAILDEFEVGHVYFPDQTGVRRYQPEYANRMAKQASKCLAHGVAYSYVSVGDVIKVGCFECKAIFQADAKKLKEKEGHHFINNMSMIYHIVVDGTWIFDMGGDAQAEAQRQMLEAFKDRLEEIVCHVMKIRWHGDRDGITKDYVNAIKCLLAFCNYHGSENGSGRKSTYNVFRERGAVVATNYKDGEIYMDIRGKKMEVKGSKTGYIKTFEL